MQTKPKSNSIVTHSRDPATGIITFLVRGCEPLTFNPSAVHAANRARAEVHGWLQRISDKAAMSRNPATGQPATPADKRARMAGLVAWLESGAAEWSPERVGGAAGPRVDAFILAGLATIHGTDEATMLARVTAAATKHGITVPVYLQRAHDGSTDNAARLREIVAQARALSAGSADIDADEELGAIGG